MCQISVILTTHNRPLLLSRAISSLIHQTFQDFEILLIADESSKETKHIAANLLRSNDTFVAIPTLKGPSGSRNLGIQLAKSKWICFLDDDDLFEIDYFEKAIELIRVNESVLHFFNYSKVSDKTSEEDYSLSIVEKVNFSDYELDQLWVSNFIPINAFFLSNENAKKYLFDMNLKSHEDWDWLLNVNGTISFVHHNTFGPLVYLSQTLTRNTTSHKDGSVILDYLSIYRRWPGKSNLIKTKRGEILSSAGLNLPVELL